MTKLSFDIINEPLEIIELVFDECNNSSDDKVEDLSKMGEVYIFEKLIQKEEVYSCIPFLSNQSVGLIHPNTLCKYRGMIQDIFDVEFYNGIHMDHSQKKPLLTKYMDCLPDAINNENFYNSSSSSLFTRQPILCVPIPGEVIWSKDMMQYHHELLPVMTVPINKFNNKRKSSFDLLSKNDEFNLNTQDYELLHQPQQTQLPILVTSNTIEQCLVKVYDGLYEQLRLNDVVEVVGIYTCDPNLSNTQLESLNDDMHSHRFKTTRILSSGIDDNFNNNNDVGEMLANNFDDSMIIDPLPPASIAPRLHCITLRKLCSAYPLFQQIQPTNTINTNIFYLDYTTLDNIVDRILQSTSRKSTHDSQNDIVKKHPFIYSVSNSVQEFKYVSCQKYSNPFNDLNWNYKVFKQLSTELMSDSKFDDINNKTTSIRNDTIIPATSTEFIKLRNDCIEVICAVAGLDCIVAEYILLNLISHIYDRTQDDTVDSEEALLGYLPLQIYGFAVNDHRVQDLHRILSQLTSKCVEIHADLFSIKSGPSLLSERGINGQLSQSSLQVAEDTLLLINETKSLTLLENNQNTTNPSIPIILNSKRALTTLVQKQQLLIKYPYFEMMIPTNTSVIVTSCSPKTSLFSGLGNLILICLDDDKTGILNASNDSLNMEESDLDIATNILEESMDSHTTGTNDSSSQQIGLVVNSNGNVQDIYSRFRTYITLCRLKHAQMHPSTLAIAEREFVEARASAASSKGFVTTTQLFHQWLTIVRLVAISFGDDEILPCHWYHMRELEQKRYNHLM